VAIQDEAFQNVVDLVERHFDLYRSVSRWDGFSGNFRQSARGQPDRVDPTAITRYGDTGKCSTKEQCGSPGYMDALEHCRSPQKRISVGPYRFRNFGQNFGFVVAFQP